ncbi:MAG TPA: AI-2E family transporter [Bacilli bacterium]|nr:AI-2E family transporter [Bacilli bacterium]
MNKLDYKKINELLKLGNKILKILYLLILILGIWLISKTWELWGVSKFLLTITKLLSPFCIGFVIAYIFNPIVSKFERKGINRLATSTIIYIILIGIIFIIIKYFFPLFVSELSNLIKIFPNIGNNLKEIINSCLNIFKDTGIDTVSMKKDIFNTIGNYFINSNNNLYINFITFTTKIFSGIGILVVGIFIGFYLLVDFKNSVKLIKNFVPRRYRKDVFEVLGRINKFMFSYINTTLLIFIMVLIISIIAFICIKLDGAVVLGLFYSLLSTIPYIGSYIAGIPILLIGFSYGFQTGILTLVCIIAIQVLITYAICPVIMCKSKKVHPVAIIFGVIILGYFFGILGVLFATIVMNIIKILIEYFDENYEIKNYNIESKEK